MASQVAPIVAQRAWPFVVVWADEDVGNEIPAAQRPTRTEKNLINTKVLPLQIIFETAVWPNI